VIRYYVLTVNYFFGFSGSHFLVLNSYITYIYACLHVRSLLLLFNFKKKSELVPQNSVKPPSKKFHEIYVHQQPSCSTQTNGRSGMAKPIATFRNFANAPSEPRLQTACSVTQCTDFTKALLTFKISYGFKVHGKGKVFPLQA
jgi:hypothetical protein